jgi:hypothetical protein
MQSGVMNADEGTVETTSRADNDIHVDLQLKFKHVNGSQLERKLGHPPDDLRGGVKS